MDFFQDSRKVTPLLLQSEAAECGLACVAMVAGYFGHETDLRSLRNNFMTSSRGTTMSDIVQMVAELHLSARPVTVDLPGLHKLQLPAILHWNFDHFVVLTKVKGNRCVIHDPASGRHEYSLEQISPHFTGVAIEIASTTQFQPKRELANASFANLIGAREPYVKPVLHALLLALIIQLMSLALPLGLQLAVDNAAVSGDRSLVILISCAVLGMVLIHAACWMARGLILSYLGSQLHFQMMQNLFRHLLKLPMSFFEKRSLADIISRFDSLRNIQRTLSQGFLEAAVDGIFALLTIIVLFQYHVMLTWCLLGGMLLYYGVRQLLYLRFYQANQETLIRVAKYQAHFMETIRGISTVKLFNRHFLREARWQNLVASAFKANHSVNSWTVGFGMLGQMITGLLWVAVIGMGANAVLNGKMSVGMVFAFAAWQQQFVTRFIFLTEKIFEFQLLKLHRERAGDISATPTEEPELRGALPLQQMAGEIELREVAYQFCRNGPMVLQSINLKIAAGESIAIVGASGEGKTTLLKIMLGLLEPSSGEVLIDGVAMKKRGLQNFREAIGAVLQDDSLFAGTIGDNIAFFDAKPDMARVLECAQMAAIHDDIASFPMGYQTLVGDMGAALSGGQKQRILLARALYRQPKILFLDEATSHLDVLRERQVNAAIGALGITRVIIAHRAETIASAARVVTLQGGKIISDVSKTPAAELAAA